MERFRSCGSGSQCKPQAFLHRVEVSTAKRMLLLNVVDTHAQTATSVPFISEVKQRNVLQLHPSFQLIFEMANYLEEFLKSPTWMQNATDAFRFVLRCQDHAASFVKATGC